MNKTISKLKTTRELEEKFARTAFRLTQERNDFFLPQVLDFVNKKKWLNLRPEYQRRLVWDVHKRSLFIESLLLNIPIPPIFLYESELGRYEVMDGQQRLNAIVGFYENKYALKGLEKWNELNGKHYKDLPDTFKRGLDRRRLSATVLLVEAEADDKVSQRSDVRKLVFERLNTGGQQLNAQELRNCLFAGHFNDLLIRLARGKLFSQIWEIPLYTKNSDGKGQVSNKLANNRLYRRMVDCEIVLRYFAFGRKRKIKGSVRSMLDSCMEDNIGITETEAQTFEKEFQERLKLAHAIFGKTTFRHKDKDGNWKLSQPLYDGIMIALDRHWNSRNTLRQKRASVAREVHRLLTRPSAYEVIVGRPNTAKAITRRIDVLTKAISVGARI